MYRAQSFNEQMMETRSEDDYSIVNAESSPGQKYVVKFTSPTESRFFSRNRFSSPSMLSRSVPRRKSNIMRSRINRSLNFDIGHRGNNNYTSPNTNMNSPNSNLHLSRSAKILKALNIDISPMKTECKRINKTLNFDSTPSPRRTPNSNRRRCSISNLSLNSPGVNKTLNFDDSSESPAPSLHETSAESIDENQNQTPSQRNRRAKKSLSYCSPHSSNGKSPDFRLLSPGLRTELREKINDIVQISMTPNVFSSKRVRNHVKIPTDLVASTPRNLFDDFSEDDDVNDGDDNDDEERPKTPKNSIIIIPDSMSAIKKSHKKERVSGRFGKLTSIEMPSQMETDDVEGRSTTPQNDEEYQTPNYNLRSIKKSHKKNKSRRKSYGHHSEDELSETGSLFDYSETGKSENNSLELEDNSECKKGSEGNPRIVITDASPLPLERKEDSDKSSTHINKIPEIVIVNATPLPSTSSRKTEGTPEDQTPPKKNPELKTSEQQTTPDENRIDYLRRIMTDSIKKSHKKIKESNKKSLFKPRILQQKIDDMAETVMTPRKTAEDEKEQPLVVTPNAKDRPGTPDNINSSRLLLNRFSSVKKSHKKDKHRKVGFAQRQIDLNTEIELVKNDSIPEKDSEVESSSPKRLKIPRICVTRASASKSLANDSLLSDSSPESEYHSLGTSPLDEDEPKPLLSTPNKRKSPSAEKPSSCKGDSEEINHKSADKEFQIFTPIKKRKPLQPTSVKDEELTEVFPENTMENERCETPKLSRRIETNSFKTPKKTIKIVSPSNTSGNRENSNDDEDNENGRSTPENQGRLDMSALSSIKKSHKKDKWTKSADRTSHLMRRSFNSHNEKNILKEETGVEASTSWRAVVSNDSNSSDCTGKDEVVEEKSPKSSPTHSKETETNSPVKTPPNSLGTKTYLRLMQTASIKRSHKKLRERKKQESMICDADFSDDGSLFDETERNSYTSFDSDCLPLDEDDRPLKERIAEKIPRSKRRCHSKNRPESEPIVDSDPGLGTSSRNRVIKTVKRKSSSPK